MAMFVKKERNCTKKKTSESSAMAVSVYLTHIRWFGRDFYVKNDGDGRYKFFPFSALSSIRISPRVWHGVWVKFPHEIVLAQLKVDERHFSSQKIPSPQKLTLKIFSISFFFASCSASSQKLARSVLANHHYYHSKWEWKELCIRDRKKSLKRTQKYCWLLGNLESCKINIFHFHPLAKP